MILQTIIYRLHDGLPLSASTDVDQRHMLNSCQKYIKLISRRLPQLPDRCSLHIEGFHIHLISTLSLTFLVVTEDRCPAVLAFCFLNEIQKQFLLNYDSVRVQNARRPYAFIEFDNSLQKCKQRYNSPRSLATKVNIPDMSTELKLRPSYLIKEEDLGIGASNGVAVRDHFRVIGPSRELEGVTWLCWLVIVMNAFSVGLNFLRGMAFIGHGHIDEADAGAYSYGFTFLFAACVHCYQVYMLFYHTRRRKLNLLWTFIALCLCIYCLSQFRNWIQTAFHLTVMIYTSCVVYNRRLKEKLDGYSV